MDLTTKYLGIELTGPFIPGSSPLADDLDSVRKLEDAGAAAISLRSLFEEQIVSEEMASYEALESHTDSFSEALSFFTHTEHFVFGPGEYLEQIQRVKQAVSIPVFASLNGVRLSNCLSYAQQMEQAGADALELNLYHMASDPQRAAAAVEDQMLEMVRVISGGIGIPVAVKLSPSFSSLPHFVGQIQQAGARGVVIFNRFFQPDIDIEQLEVSRELQLSDSSDLLLRLRWLAVLFGQTDISLAVTGGVHTAEDALKAVMAGADAVQMVSALLKHGPSYLGEVKAGVVRWLEEHEYESLAQARGSMSLQRCPDPAAYARGNYAEILTSWQGHLL